MSYLGRGSNLTRKAQDKVSFLATAGQTVRTGLSYVPTHVDVTVNGITLTEITDYTATNGNSITFSVALALNDEVTIVSSKTFELANHYTISAANTLLAAKATNTALATTNTAVALKAPLATPSFTGNATITSGNLVIGTNGKGIDFSANADSSATGASTTSEILDDYEEGSWTMAVVGAAGSAGSWAMSGRAARYTKVGRVVHFSATGFLTNLGSYTGSSTLRITGLPFACDSGMDVACSASSMPIGQYNATNYVPQVMASQSYLQVRKNQYGDSTAIYNEQGLNIRWNISGTYNTA